MLCKLKPDIFVLFGDRYEMLAATVAAYILRVPIAHIAGGESTEAMIDEGIEEFSSFLQQGCAFTDLNVAGAIKFDDFTLTLASDVFMDAEEPFVPAPEAAIKAVTESLRGIQNYYEQLIKIAID